MSWKDKIKSFQNSFDDEYDEDIYEEEPREKTKTKRSNDGGQSGKIVDIHATAKLQVVLRKPERFSECKMIADELLTKKTIVLNLEETEREEAGKLVNFLSGAAYTLGGNLKRIAKNTFIITPYEVDVMGADLIDELENNGLFL